MVIKLSADIIIVLGAEDNKLTLGHFLELITNDILATGFPNMHKTAL